MSDSSKVSDWTLPSLVTGGILIVVGGLAGGLMMGAFGTGMGTGMMGGTSSLVPSAWVTGVAWWMGAVGVLSGTLVLVAAYLLQRGESPSGTIGTLAIAGGALSLLAMGGWLVGAILAILGGAMALSRREAPRLHAET